MAHIINYAMLCYSMFTLRMPSAFLYTMQLQTTGQHETDQMPQALEQKALQQALELGSHGLAKVSHISPMKHNPFWITNCRTV